MTKHPFSEISAFCQTTDDPVFTMLRDALARLDRAEPDVLGAKVCLMGATLGAALRHLEEGRHDPPIAGISEIAREIAIGCNLDPDAISAKAAAGGHQIPEWMFFTPAAERVVLMVKNRARRVSPAEGGDLLAPIPDQGGERDHPLSKLIREATDDFDRGASRPEDGLGAFVARRVQAALKAGL